MKTMAHIRANWKNSLVCAAFGSIFTIFGMIFSPLDAQRDKFGEIECTKLTVIDSDNGNPLVKLDRGDMHVGRIMIFGKKTDRLGEFVRLSVDEHGGELLLFGNSDTEAKAIIEVNEYGNGAVSTWKHDGQRFHTLGLTNPNTPQPVTNTVSVPTSENAIENSIDGFFHGWNGETIIKLKNGQIWQQDQLHVSATARINPKVLIYKADGRYKILVDGDHKAIYVKRLK